MTKTLSQFIQSRRTVENVAVACPEWADLDGFDCPGFVYEDGMVITKQKDLLGEDRLHLLIFCDQYDECNTVAGLERLERRLYLHYLWECTNLGKLIDDAAEECSKLDDPVMWIRALIGQPNKTPAILFFSGPGRDQEAWDKMQNEERVRLLTAYVDADVLFYTPTTLGTTEDRLAEAFGRVLRMQLASFEFTEVVARNATNDNPAICHSHDFCDANMAMSAAFKLIMGRESDPSSQIDADVWNAAWTKAKAAGFRYAIDKSGA